MKVPVLYLTDPSDDWSLQQLEDPRRTRADIGILNREQVMEAFRQLHLEARSAASMDQS